MNTKALTDNIKKIAWFFIQPIHPFMRDGLLSMQVIKHEGRQPYTIGKLRAGKTAEELRAYLITEKGFENHFPCWIDDGEVVDVRLRENFDWQYHLRIFKDGEIRGHHEYTPESHPIAHLKDQGSTARREEFMRFLEGWVERNGKNEQK